MANYRRLAGIGTAAIVASAMPGAAYAQPTFGFDLPAQKLGDALRSIGARGGTSIAFDPALVRGKTAPAIKGVMGIHKALDRALAGSGLAARPSGMGYIVTLASGQPSGDAGTASLGGDGSSDIVVTGSHIKGLTDGASPVRVIDAEQIRRSGSTTVAQLMRTAPENFGGGLTEENSAANVIPQNASNNPGRANGINLRGLGSDATLVLFDGFRLPFAGGGYSVDVSTIPLTLIDHVDILKDGASSIYGSDAVGGVVNLVTISKLDGIAASAHSAQLPRDTSWMTSTISLGDDLGPTVAS